jgi:Domain of unknown function (DUF4157)
VVRGQPLLSRVQDPLVTRMLGTTLALKARVNPRAVPFVPPVATMKRPTPRSNVIPALEGWTAPKARPIASEPRFRLAPEAPIQPRVPTETVLESEPAEVPQQIETRSDDINVLPEIETRVDATIDSSNALDIELQADETEARDLESLNSSTPVDAPETIDLQETATLAPSQLNALETLEAGLTLESETISNDFAPESLQEPAQNLVDMPADELTTREARADDAMLENSSTSQVFPEGDQVERISTRAAPQILESFDATLTPKETRDQTVSAPTREEVRDENARVISDALAKRPETRENDRVITSFEQPQNNDAMLEMVKSKPIEQPSETDALSKETPSGTREIEVALPSQIPVSETAPAIEILESTPAISLEIAQVMQPLVTPPLEISEVRADVLNTLNARLEAASEIPVPETSPFPPENQVVFEASSSENQVALKASPEAVSRPVNEPVLDALDKPSRQTTTDALQPLETADQIEISSRALDVLDRLAPSSEPVVQTPTPSPVDQSEPARANPPVLERANRAVPDAVEAREAVLDDNQPNSETPSSTQETRIPRDTVLDGVPEAEMIPAQLEDRAGEAESEPRSLEAETIDTTTNELGRVQDALAVLPDAMPNPATPQQPEQRLESTNENASTPTDNAPRSSIRPDAHVVETFMPRRPRPVAPAKLESSSAPRADAPTDAAINPVDDAEAIDRLFQAWRRPEDRFAPNSNRPTPNAPPTRAAQPNTVQNAVNDATPIQASSNTPASDESDVSPAAPPDALLDTLFRVWTRPEDRFAPREDRLASREDRLASREIPRPNAPNPSPIDAPQPRPTVNPRPESQAQPGETASRAPVSRETAPQATPRSPAPRTPLEQSGDPGTEANGLADALPNITSNPAFVAALGTPQVVADALEPTPLPESTRRFLRPIVGMDPSEARVHRGPLADAIALSKDADAVTIGRDVFMADGHADGEPETLGLLAHELTHVARFLEPRFVPPVARNTNSFQAPASNPEERLAMDVESRVINEAQARLDSGSSLESGVGEISGPPSSFFDTNNTVQDGVPDSRAERFAPDPWNGLPAPWEPMPAASDTRSSSGTATPAPNFSTPSFSAPSFTAPSAFSSSDAGGAVAQTAERSRDADAGSGGPHTDHAPDAKGAPKQDMDALARQVYAILKRKLDAERRRGF